MPPRKSKSEKLAEEVGKAEEALAELKASARLVAASNIQRNGKKYATGDELKAEDFGHDLDYLMGNDDRWEGPPAIVYHPSDAAELKEAEEDLAALQAEAAEAEAIEVGKQQVARRNAEREARIKARAEAEAKAEAEPEPEPDPKADSKDQ